MLPDWLERALAKEEAKPMSPVDAKLEGFDPVRDILVVPSSERIYVRSGIRVIGLDDVHNVAKVRV